MSEDLAKQIAQMLSPEADVEPEEEFDEAAETEVVEGEETSQEEESEEVSEIEEVDPSESTESTVEENSDETDEESSEIVETETTETAETAETSELSALQQQVAGLQQLLNLQAAQLAQTSTKKTTTEPVNLLEGVDLDELYSNPEVLNQVLLKAVDLGRSQAEQVAKTTSQQTVVEQFYTKNPELVPFKDTVSLLTKVIVSERPDLTTAEQVLAETERRAKLMLNIPVKQQVKTGAKAETNANVTVERVVKTPASGRKSTKRKPVKTSTPSKLEADLEAMRNLRY